MLLSFLPLLLIDNYYLNFSLFALTPVFLQDLLSYVYAPGLPYLT
jgi:hypothetical protein